MDRKRQGGSGSTGNGSGGIWVGIDLGTSNCACAVWDSTRGGAKWMRLPRHLLATPSGKDGRTVPSAVLLTQKRYDDKDYDDDDNRNLEHGIDSILLPWMTKKGGRSWDEYAAWVGEAALLRRNKLQGDEENDDEEQSLCGTTTTTSTTLVRSVKRILGKRLEDLSPDLVRSLPLELIQDGEEEEEEGDGFVRVPEEEKLHSSQRIPQSTSTSTSTNTSNKQERDVFVRVRVIPEQDHDLSNFNEEDGPQNVPPLVASSLSLSPVQIQALLLRSIRLAAQDYLQQRKVLKKKLQVPGGRTVGGAADAIQNVVVGVPAHFSSTQRQLVQDACRLAGFTGHVSTLMESTAAAMAYGLSFNTPGGDDDNDDEHRKQHQTILVVDMGGGTTDVTIATREPQTEPHEDSSSTRYGVVVTEGDAQLGGDDMDQAILDYVLERTSNPSNNKKKKKQGGDSSAPRILSLAQRRSLLQSCRIAKESLCDSESLPAQVEVEFQGQKVTITQDNFKTILTPWIGRARSLIQTAVQRFQEASTREEVGDDDTPISEVVLVGGATRVPAVRQMLQEIFPTVELCTSLDPMGSVAQGLAIHAAFLSKDVPKSLLKSALMLDSIPHAIGVQVGGGKGGEEESKEDLSSTSPTFIPILKRNARLPAMGFATFALADLRQPGVTIRAVEQIGDSDDRPVYEPLAKEDFTFLLRRLPEEEIEQLSKEDQARTIDVGMKMDTDGKFIVSIFDQSDPEQVRRKERFQQLKDNDNRDAVSELSYIADLIRAESEMTKDQWFLLAATVGLFVFYIAIKIAFAEPISEEDGARIL